MNRFFRTFFLGVSFFVIGMPFFYCYGATLIFDLDGVLVKKSALMSGWHIGPKTFLGFYNPFSIEKKLFSFLNNLEPRLAQTPQAYYKGMLMPQIMCDWLCGTKTTQEIRLLIQAGLNNSSFSNEKIKTIIGATAQFIFTPSMLSTVIYPIKDHVNILKRCYKEKDVYGKRKHTIYLLSNWDKESFALLYNKPSLKNIFKYCDGMVISGNVGLMKPDPAIFEYLFTLFDVNPDDELTIFIDDQEANITAAQNLHKKQLHPIWLPNINTKQLRHELHRLQIL